MLSSQSAAHKVRFWDYTLQKSLSMLLTSSKVYVVKTVDELLFRGYKDNVLTMGLMIAEDAPPYDKFGWFYMVCLLIRLVISLIILVTHSHTKNHLSANNTLNISSRIYYRFMIIYSFASLSLILYLSRALLSHSIFLKIFENRIEQVISLYCKPFMSSSRKQFKTLISKITF